jgi:hypothetical protein
MSERTARDMVKRLEASGHLSIKVGHGPGHPSRYTLLAKRQAAAGIETGSGLPVLSEGNRRPAAAKPAVERPETGSRLPTNHSEPLLNQEEGARATLIPENFRLSDETYCWALDRLGSNDAVDRSVERFRNHYRQVTGKAATSRDWDARVHNWIDDDAQKRTSSISVVGASKRLQEKSPSFDTRPDMIADARWELILSTYAKVGFWTNHVSEFGPPPTSPGCRVPRRLLIRHGIIKESAA